MTRDEFFMKKAIAEALKAKECNEVPVGAIIVLEDKVIARAFNMREKKNDPTAHAEILAIRKACKKLSSWRLEKCTIYITLEPCSMCAGTLIWTRIKRIVFGASDLKGGALGSSYDLVAQKGINHFPDVERGILEEECRLIIKEFFQNKRKQMEEII